MQFPTRVAIFREKNSAENGADGNFDSYHRNSYYSAEDRKAKNSIPNHFPEKKNTWMTLENIFSRNSIPFHTRMAFEKHLFKEFCSVPFCSEPRNGPSIDTQNSAKGRKTFFPSITKTIASLFRGISSERNFLGNPSPGTFRLLYGTTLLEKYA
jgi:hypothetical protein